MNTFKNVLLPLGILILAIALIGGAGYAYHKDSLTNSQNENLISSVQNQFRQSTAEEQRLAVLAETQASLQTATTRLAQLRASLSPVKTIADAYDTFQKEAKALSDVTSHVHGSKAAELAAANQGIADTLQAWRLLLSTIPPSGPSSAQILQAQQYASQLQTYVNQIQTIADGLTPANSGLTQTQIVEVQLITTNNSTEAGNTTNDLAVALPVTNTTSTTGTGSTVTDSSAPSSPTNTTDSGTTNTTLTTTTTSTTSTTSSSSTTSSGASSNTSSGVTAADVAAQQQVVNQLQQQVDQLQQQASSTVQTSGTTAAPGTQDNTTPPPLQVDQFGRPILIQGTNTDIYRNP